MAAAMAMLTAKAKQLKTNAATKHATSIATEHAGFRGEVCSFENTDLEKLVALLLWMSQDFQTQTHSDDIHRAAFDAIIKCADTSTGGTLGLLHAASVAKLSKVIDIMTLHKDGSPKDANATLAFMRRVASFRDEPLAQRASSNDNATARVELDEGDVSVCYQRLGRDLITHDLLPHQKKNPRCRL